MQNASLKSYNNYRVLESSWHSSNCFANDAKDGNMCCKLRAIFQ